MHDHANYVWGSKEHNFKYFHYLHCTYLKKKKLYVLNEESSKCSLMF